jgi:hypothetical protein
VLSRLRHKATSSGHAKPSFGGLVANVPPGLLYNVAACLGNDLNKSVRAAMSAKVGSASRKPLKRVETGRNHVVTPDFSD